MISNYDIKKLEQMQKDFSYVTGVSITPYDAKGNPITTAHTLVGDYCTLVNLTESGRLSCGKSNRLLIQKCRESKKTERHICASGLCDIAMPLLHRDEIIGFLMIGQIRTSEVLPKSALALHADREKIEELYYKIPLFDEKMIESVVNIGAIMTKYIVFENLIKARPQESASVIADYIDEHLGDKLTVESISRNTHISVSGIYKCMKRTYGKTLGEYILDLRLNRAELLMREENMSIEKIAETVGFSDSAYFSRCFKKSRGIAPMKYKKIQKELDSKPIGAQAD